MDVVDSFSTALIPAQTGLLDANAYQAIKSTGDGNCLYNAVSLAINGEFAQHAYKINGSFQFSNISAQNNRTIINCHR